MTGNGTTFYVNPISTNVVIGNNATNSKLEVKASYTSQIPFKVKHSYNLTKIRVHPKGGVSIGNILNPPDDGLAIENHNLKILNHIGNTVYTQEKINSPSIEINIGNYTKGIYFLYITDNETIIFTEKLIIQ